MSEMKVKLEDILQGKTVVWTGIFLQDCGSVVEFGKLQPEADVEEIVAPKTPKEEDK